MAQMIPLALITRNPKQPRETFPQEHIERLAASIAKRGLIQPITVCPAYCWSNGIITQDKEGLHPWFQISLPSLTPQVFLMEKVQSQATDEAISMSLPHKARPTKASKCSTSSVGNGAGLVPSDVFKKGKMNNAGTAMNGGSEERGKSKRFSQSSYPTLELKKRRRKIFSAELRNTSPQNDMGSLANKIASSSRNGKLRPSNNSPKRPITARKVSPCEDENLASPKDRKVAGKTLVGSSLIYVIVAGECRFRAHQLLGRKTIRCEIVEIDADEMQLRAIVENLQRQDMNPIEEGRAYQTLVDQGYTLARIVEELGLGGTAVVQNRIDLLELDVDVQSMVAKGTLPVSMAWAVRLAPRSQQTKMVRDIASGRLKTVEQVRHAGIALRDAEQQMDAFADAPKVSAKDVATFTRLELRIDAVASVVIAGFKDGECVAAQRVSPDRVKTMADKLTLIRKHILQMEHDLRCVATQTEIKLEFNEGRKRA